MVQKGANRTIKDNSGNAPIHYAARKGYLEVLKHLIEKDPDSVINLQDNTGSTALTWAAYRNQPIMTQVLLEKGANRTIKNNYGFAPIHDAARNGYLEVLKLLIEKDPDSVINSQDNVGNTALIWAASKNHLDVIQVLLHSGAKTSIKDNSGKTALDWAKSKQHRDIIEILKNSK